ncbi:hypothetical protein CDD83_6589 [Cordyceps sp. RAO-2017]|nr:hypothetical protein CDD83_6589 [Cordyceps sp. RAO-2017]
MAASTSAVSISMYAELLPNIRQVTVAATLPTPSDATTSADVVDGGRRIRLLHQGRSETLELPAVVLTRGPPVLAVPQMPRSSLSWRLPVSMEQASAIRSAPESQAIPWSSVDLAPGSAIACRDCGTVIVRASRIRVWKDLPSENWAEMMEFWHCHKPHDHGKHDDEALANKGYGANSAITAQIGVGFVDITTFMLAESDCDNLLSD